MSDFLNTYDMGILAFWPAIGAFVSFAFDVGVALMFSAGMAWLGELLSGGPLREASIPGFSNYPMGNSEKGIPIPKVYGTCRLAGNILWMGPSTAFIIRHKAGSVNTGFFGMNKKRVYQNETRYRRSFLIGICEGPASIRRAWMGDDEIELTDFTQYRGNGLNTLTDQTEEDCGDYPNLLCAWFDEYDVGNTDSIPNFVFEVATVTGNQFTWLSENSVLWAVPLQGSTHITLDPGGQAVDEGGGIVSLPFSNNPFVEGNLVTINGTTNYDGAHTLTEGTNSLRLYFADGFNAETFDGSETVVRYISGLNGVVGRSDQDSEGNMYYGIQWDAGNRSHVIKIALDGTITYPFSVPIGYENGYAKGVKIVGNYLYYVVVNGFKFNLTTGASEWVSASTAADLCYGMDCDEDGNIYTGYRKISNEDGTITTLTYMSQFKPLVVGGAGSNETKVDDALGIAIWGGLQYELLHRNENDLYNLAVRTFDNLAGDQIAVGGVYDGGGGLYTTYTIGYGCIATNGEHIFVLISGATGREIYKYSWDGTSLTEVDHITSAATHACGIYFDLHGNLVVVNQDGTDDDVFWFYDTDLNYITKLSNYQTNLLSTWSTSLPGAAYIQGNVNFHPASDSGVYDANPSDIIKDLISNTRYGAGISTDYIDADSFLSCRQYWQEQEQLISLVLKDQKPIMDWIDYILLHCNGYRYWSGGKLCLGVFKDDDSLFELTQENLVYEEGQPPVQVTKRPYSDTWNRIEIAWTDRDNMYDGGIAVAQDEVDQRVCGSIRRRTIDLMGITKAGYAERQVHRLLIDSMYRFTIYTFRVGYENMLFEVGDVGTLSDGFQISSQKVRIIGVNESKDGRVLEVTAVEDISRLYPDLSSYVTQPNEREPDPEITLSETTLNYREDLDEPVLFLSLAPTTEYCNGWSLFFSYDDETYEFVGNILIEGVTEGQCNSVGTLTTALNDVSGNTVVHKREESFEVNIGTVTDLKTTITDEALFQGRAICKIGDEIIGYKSCVETATPGVWKVSQLIRGMFGSTPSAHAIGDTFATLDIDLGFEFNLDNIGQTLYFKPLTFYANEGQELADVTATEITIEGRCARPAPATLIRLASDEMDGGFGNYSGDAIDLYWNLCMKPWNRSMGPDETAWKYGDDEADLIVADGVVLENYSEDDLLEAVDLLYQHPGGDMIGQDVLGVVSTASISKAGDLDGNNPTHVVVLPRRTLRTWKQNYLYLDDGS